MLKIWSVPKTKMSRRWGSLSNLAFSENVSFLSPGSRLICGSLRPPLLLLLLVSVLTIVTRVLFASVLRPTVRDVALCLLLAVDAPLLILIALRIVATLSRWTGAGTSSSLGGLLPSP